MTRSPQRIIEAAIFSGQIGLVSAAQLVEMAEDDWGYLRDRLTDYNNGKVDGLEAKCLACGSRVYIQTRVWGDRRLPYFAHYSGGDPSCPWYVGKAMRPDMARALQYQGQQESIAHKLMCEAINNVVRLDPRLLDSRVERYVPPKESEHGRYPDVYVEWTGWKPFAIEFQMSNTFQTEISQRCIHYEREDCYLIWVLGDVDFVRNDVSQSFRDVIRRHRGNAFVFDRQASEASYRAGTLVLTCYLRSPSKEYGFGPPTLVRFDSLTFPESGLPYLEDRLIAPKLDRACRRRQEWLHCLSEWDMQDPYGDWIKLLSFPTPVSSCGEKAFQVIRLVGAALSIFSLANGAERNFVTRHANIKGMLNTLLNPRIEHGGLAPYADLLMGLIRKTRAHLLLEGSVGQHLQRARGTPQVSCDSVGSKLLTSLFPEALDPFFREELIGFLELPSWAQDQS